MNIANLVAKHASENPHLPAIIFPEAQDRFGRYCYSSLSFYQFEQQSNFLSHRLNEWGIERGQKVLLFVRPSIEFCLIAFSLFKIGAVAVLIDPGMGRKNLLKAIAEVEPDVLIAVPEIHFARLIFRKAFKSISKFIQVSGKVSSRELPMERLKASSKPDIAGFLSKNDYLSGVHFPVADMGKDELAGIFFTSGGTGKPKGVCYTQSIWFKQIELIQELFGMKPGDRDFPAFPLFALFSMSQGVTAVIPDMNPSKPSTADPEKLFKNIQDNQVNFAGGSPTIWKILGEYCQKNHLKLPSVKGIMMFGAPVSTQIHQLFQEVLPNGTVLTPYGATECLPVTCTDSSTVLNETIKDTMDGKGTCVGFPVSGLEVAIVEHSKHPIESDDNLQRLGPNQVGEILVRGAQVTRRYYRREEATKMAKIPSKESKYGFWHRMGDMGYLDEKGRLWFCGRAVHFIKNLNGKPIYSVPTEAVFNNHPEVSRTALVKVESNNLGGKPAIVVERRDKKVALTSEEKAHFKSQLLTIAKKFDHTREIDTFFIASEFPVDVRHNIKIDRKLLSEQIQKSKRQPL